MFSARLKELRSKKGLYQKDLSKMLSVSRSTVTSYETGQRNPDVYILMKIADIFDVSIDYLMGRTNLEKKACSYFQAIEDDVFNLIASIDLGKNGKEMLVDHLKFAKEQIEKLPRI